MQYAPRVCTLVLFIVRMTFDPRDRAEWGEPGNVTIIIPTFLSRKLAILYLMFLISQFLAAFVKKAYQ